MNIFQKSLAVLLSWSLVVGAVPRGTAGADQADESGQSEAKPTDSVATESPEQLQQLVAPIALYPDSLVAQILAASTFPEEIVEADRWVQSHPDLKGDALGQAIDQEPWDPSVKALAAFPSVLGNMDKNLSWTSSLGDAYYNQEQDVMNAIQVMRRRAQEAGNLNSTSQQTVTTEDSDIKIEPASPEIVYVPAYDPWIVYGGPIVVWPGWYPYPGIWYDGPSLFFGVGFGIGFFGDYGWGWDTGVPIGITITPSTTTSGITRGAGRSITATDSIEAKARAVCTTVLKGHQSLLPATMELLAAMPSLMVRAMFVPVPPA
jgi:Protein of unknown function (DUF3300)